MGVCGQEWGQARGIFRDEPGRRIEPVCLVRQKLGKCNASCWREEAQRVGIHDMTGNVWEWCADGYDAGYYKNSPQFNPKGTGRGGLKVVRGGSWGDIPWFVRAAYRLGYAPAGRYNNFGFV